MKYINGGLITIVILIGIIGLVVAFNSENKFSSCIYEGYFDKDTPFWEFYCGDLSNFDIKEYPFIRKITQEKNNWLIIFADRNFKDYKNYNRFLEELEKIIMNNGNEEEFQKIIEIFNKKTGKNCDFQFSKLEEGYLLICK